MKKCLLFYIFLSVFSFVPAQEYFPKHFGYELTILPSEEKEVKLENVSFVAINMHVEKVKKEILYMKLKVAFGWVIIMII